jgi:hypothetical protein
MWRLKGFGKNKADIVRNERLKIQVFQDRKFLGYGRDKLVQILSRNQEADPAYAVMVLEGEHDLFFSFSGFYVTFINIVDYERKGR